MNSIHAFTDSMMLFMDSEVPAHLAKGLRWELMKQIQRPLLRGSGVVVEWTQTWQPDLRYRPRSYMVGLRDE